MDKTLSLNASIDKPNEMLAFAKELKKVIVEQKLYTNIQGKNYPHVEAWQFCGGVLGVMPVVLEVEDLSSDNIIKYKVTVELIRAKNGKKVGSGFAICSNQEKNKKSFEEYAIVGMAQTRAISRAYRNAFGWIIKLAGYEATPAEEVTDNYLADEETLEGIINANK